MSTSQRRPPLQLDLERHDLVEQVGEPGLEALQLGEGAVVAEGTVLGQVGPDLHELVTDCDHRRRDLVGFLTVKVRNGTSTSGQRRLTSSGPSISSAVTEPWRATSSNGPPSAGSW